MVDMNLEEGIWKIEGTTDYMGYDISNFGGVIYLNSDKRISGRFKYGDGDTSIIFGTFRNHFMELVETRMSAKENFFDSSVVYLLAQESEHVYTGKWERIQTLDLGILYEEGIKITANYIERGDIVQALQTLNDLSYTFSIISPRFMKRLSESGEGSATIRFLERTCESEIFPNS